MRRLVVPGLAATLLLAACGGDTIVNAGGGQERAGLSVVGVGRVEVRPDTLVVALGVEATRPSAPEALEAMTTAANAMIDAIRDAGVADEDIQTVSLSVREARVPPPGRPGVPIEEISIQGAPEAGFVGEQRLRIRIRDLDRGGEVIQSAVDAAGPDARVFNMSLDIAEPDAAIAQARSSAVEDALARAREMAEAAGIELGVPIAIEELDAPLPSTELAFDIPPSAEAGGGFDAATATAGLAADIEPGVRDLEVRVLVRFAIER